MISALVKRYLHNGRHEFLRAFLCTMRIAPRIVQDIRTPPDTLIDDMEVEFHAQGATQQANVIFSTHSGIYVFDGSCGVCRKVMSGKCYGITKCGDEWLVGRSNAKGPKDRRVSSICRVRIRWGEPTRVRTVLHGIPSEIHQIDVLDGALYMPHTGYNQILTIPLRKVWDNQLHITLLSCKIIPIDIHQTSHLNSIFSDGTSIYLIAHNNTAHTGKTSDLATLEPNSGNIVLKETKASSAHNVYCDDNCIMYCDSQNKKLVRDNTTIYTSDKLLRGLSITKEHIYVGGSDICFDRNKRFSTEASIYILDRQGKEVGRLNFPKLGNLCEIRQFSSFDYAMCASKGIQC